MTKKSTGIIKTLKKKELDKKDIEPLIQYLEDLYFEIETKEK